VNEPEDEPTILTASDIDRFVEVLMNSEIKKHNCFKCSGEYFGGSYGHHIGECDECWFSRFPKAEVEAFYRSFFE
jgi:hypothetical protein